MEAGKCNCNIFNQHQDESLSPVWMYLRFLFSYLVFLLIHDQDVPQSSFITAANCLSATDAIPINLVFLLQLFLICHFVKY